MKKLIVAVVLCSFLFVPAANAQSTDELNAQLVATLQQLIALLTQQVASLQQQLLARMGPPPAPVVEVPTSTDALGAVIAPAVVVNPVAQPTSTPSIAIDFAHPSDEAVTYFYDIFTNNCPSHRNLFLPFSSVPVACGITFDGYLYPQDAPAPFLCNNGACTPLSWLKEHKLVFSNLDEFNADHRRYSCQMTVANQDNGQVTWGGSSENPYSGCKDFISEFDASH